MEESHAGADRQSILQFMTTEHFTLQTARAVANAEITSRLQLYLGTLSSAIIALALTAQLSGLGVAFQAFALVLFAGLIVFNLFSECAGRAAGLVVAVPNYVKRVVFPLEILPVSVVGSALFHALMSLSALLLFQLILTGSIPATVIFLPLVVVPLVMVSLAMTWFLAALGVFVRDIGYVVSLGLQVLLFATPIFSRSCCTSFVISSWRSTRLCSTLCSFTSRLPAKISCLPCSSYHLVRVAVMCIFSMMLRQPTPVLYAQKLISPSCVA